MSQASLTAAEAKGCVASVLNSDDYVVSKSHQLLADSLNVAFGRLKIIDGNK